MERYCSTRDVFLEQVAKTTGQVSFSWFYMSPVKNGFITYDKLFDGSITLFDLCKMNECLEFSGDFNENLRKALEEKHGK